MSGHMVLEEKQFLHLDACELQLDVQYLDMITGMVQDISQMTQELPLPDIIPLTVFLKISLP